MTTISKDNNCVTLINVFTVEPENQERLVDVLTEATEKVMSRHPGFICCVSDEYGRIRPYS